MEKISLARKRLESLTRVHIHSFNFSQSQGLFFLNFYLNEILKKNKKQKFSMNVFGFHLSFPKFLLPTKKIKKIPRHSRELKINYNGDFLMGVSFLLKNYQKKSLIFKFGDIPIMVKSIKCNLYEQKKKQLIELDEEEIELGGYFILNGVEKMLRLLILPKKNMPITISRLANVARGNLCTSFSSSFRSVDRLQGSRTIHLHSLKNGGIQARVVIQKKEFFIPVIILIKALNPISDKEIVESLDIFFSKDKFFRSRILSTIKDAHEKCDLKNQKKILEFLGKIFSFVYEEKKSSFLVIGEDFLKNHLLINLGNEKKAKSELLMFMVKKLLSVQKGVNLEDNPDSIASQEFLLPGHLVSVYFKEKFENVFSNIFLEENFNSKIFQNTLKIEKSLENFYFKNFLKKFFKTVTSGLTQIVSTGTYDSKFNNELSQNNGLSISLERINFGRFLSYFRSVHRGKFFFELKNTSGRKLLPQSWGFLCPVHTPDGSLCGILNHLSLSVSVTLSNPLDSEFLLKYFNRFFPKKIRNNSFFNFSEFFIDGKILGSIPEMNFKILTDKLRAEKVSSVGKLSIGCEIIFIPRFHKKSYFPGCFLLSQEARPVRPISWAKQKKKISSLDYRKRGKNFLYFFSEIEMIGTLEQCFLNVNNLDSEKSFFGKNFGETHFEIESSSILSVIAGATPFSDLNQSPRNMYQCQMSKQSIGTPFYTYWRRDDTKSFFLLNPQVPICRNKIIQDGLGFDSFPNGFNSIVSVITYTGFDMEDAMIINKSSIERGFSLSTVYNCFDLEIKQHSGPDNFGKESKINKNFASVGNVIQKGDPLLPCKTPKSLDKNIETFFCYNSSEKANIDQLKSFSQKQNFLHFKRNLVKLRSKRKPYVGDKFASRHGQKGIFSYNFHAIDLPFSGVGMNPEIIFNPHGFPSRMTIGVMLESIVGKTGALDGIFQDTSPFKFGQNRAAVYHYGEKLRKSGFQFFGNETLFSGFSGEPFSMDIFFGVVNYQRLRHMVLDKYQVSNLGPKNSLTRQPIKGKKSGGSIRFGEMERDAVLGQGCVFLLHDRLQAASDLHGTKMNLEKGNFFDFNHGFEKKQIKYYKKNITSRKILLPYVLKYLVSEMISINIKIKFWIK